MGNGQDTSVMGVALALLDGPARRVRPTLDPHWWGLDNIFNIELAMLPTDYRRRAPGS